MFRRLTLGTAQKEAARKVVDFAERRENWYRPGDGVAPPGDREGHVLGLEDFRCVFSMTVSNGALYRHLSVSVPEAGKLPHPVAFCAIAGLFGFTPPPRGPQGQEPIGFSKSWALDINKDENCVVAVEKVRELPVA